MNKVALLLQLVICLLACAVLGASTVEQGAIEQDSGPKKDPGQKKGARSRSVIQNNGVKIPSSPPEEPASKSFQHNLAESFHVGRPGGKKPFSFESLFKQSGIGTGLGAKKPQLGTVVEEVEVEAHNDNDETKNSETTSEADETSSNKNDSSEKGSETGGAEDYDDLLFEMDKEDTDQSHQGNEGPSTVVLQEAPASSVKIQESGSHDFEEFEF